MASYIAFGDPRLTTKAVVLKRYLDLNDAIEWLRESNSPSMHDEAKRKGYYGWKSVVAGDGPVEFKFSDPSTAVEFKLVWG